MSCRSPGKAATAPGIGGALSHCKAATVGRAIKKAQGRESLGFGYIKKTVGQRRLAARCRAATRRSRTGVRGFRDEGMLTVAVRIAPASGRGWFDERSSSMFFREKD